MLPKWQKHLPHKLHSQPHLPMETTSYGEAWRTFRKQKFGLCSTTYYSTVPITCTQTRIHHTQSLHYDKLLKRSSLRHYRYNELRCNDISWWYIFCFAGYRCNEVSLEQYLVRYREHCTDISMIYRFNVRQSMRCFADTSAINRENKARYSSIIVCITFAQYCIQQQVR